MLNFSDLFVQERWDYAKKLARAAGKTYNPSELRILCQLVDNQASFRILLRSEDGNLVSSNWEKRLGQFDKFIPLAWGMYVAKSATAAALINAEPQTYPNGTILDTSTATGLPTVWNNGSIQYEVNQSVIMPYHAVKDHYEIPEEQAGTVRAAISGPMTYTNEFSGYRMDYGMRVCAPYRLEFDGNQSQEMRLNLQTGATLAPGSGAHYFLVRIVGVTINSYFAS